MAAVWEVVLPLLLVLSWGAVLKAAGGSPSILQDAEFTFLLPAGRRECFYQVAPSNRSMDVEYQVGGCGYIPEQARSRGDV